LWLTTIERQVCASLHQADSSRACCPARACFIIVLDLRSQSLLLLLSTNVAFTKAREQLGKDLQDKQERTQELYAKENCGWQKNGKTEYMFRCTPV